MKQQINQKQWDDLPESSKEKLSEWVRVRSMNAYLGIDWRKEFALSIGQMIEFLSDKDEAFLLTNGLGEAMGINNGVWKVGIGRLNQSLDHGIRTGDNPCDALWKAVKEVLEK